MRHEGIYDQLSQIAPTVFTESSGTNWKDGFELVAEALGREDAGQKALGRLPGSGRAARRRPQRQ